MTTTTQDIGIYTCGRNATEQPNGCYLINVAGLRDPQSNRGFKKSHADGRAGEIQAYVKEDPRTNAIIDQMVLLAHDASLSKGESWISFILQDHHGIWIAPAIGELAKERLTKMGYKVVLVHFTINEMSKGLK